MEGDVMDSDMVTPVVDCRPIRDEDDVVVVSGPYRGKAGAVVYVRRGDDPLDIVIIRTQLGERFPAVRRDVRHAEHRLGD